MAVLFCSLLVLSLTCVPAMAQDTEVYTAVPEQHTVTVSLEKGGAVIDAEGAVHTESFTATVSHDGVLSLILRPDSGYAVDTARLNGQDVTVSGGSVVLAHIRQDSELNVAWKQAPAPPTQTTYTVVGTVTGDDSMLVCWLAAMLAAGALVILLAACRKRKKTQG